MDYQKYETHCSSARLKRYFDSVKGDTGRAIRLYNLNMKLSQSFFVPLTVFEVTLRNRINHVIGTYFGDSDWIINQKGGFMSHPSLTQIHRRTEQPRVEDFLKSQVIKAETDLRKKGGIITSGRIVAEQPLAFWVSFFNSDYFRILSAIPMQVFTALPSGKGRTDVSYALDEIRRLRNRIFHHEPICFSGSHTIDVVYASNLNNKIVEVLDWIDPDICLEFTDIHEVGAVLNQITSL